MPGVAMLATKKTLPPGWLLAAWEPSVSKRAEAVVGWDAGPFNDFPDRLSQLETHEPCDRDGARGAQGQVHPGLLRCLFERAVVTLEGENFFERPLPRSCDPQWYRLLPELTADRALDGSGSPS